MATLSEQRHQKHSPDAGDPDLFQGGWLTPLPRPDQQIRLVHLPLRSRSSKKDIEITMSTYQLANAPEYRALSYTWGPALCEPSADCLKKDDVVNTPQKHVEPRIRCNGKEVRISQSLLESLECISVRYAGIMLWIDALCIGQDNAVEKSQQIGLMGEIYHNAHLVLVWLGAATQSTSRLAEQYRTWCGSRHEERRRSFYHDLDRDYDASKTASKEQKIAVEAGRALVQRNWFHRKWTFQECVLAKSIKLLCGQHVFDFEVIVDMLDLLPEPGKVQETGPDCIDPAIREICWNMTAIAHSREALAAKSPKVTISFLDEHYGGHSLESIMLVFLLMTVDRRATKKCDEFRSLFALCDLQARRLGNPITSISDYLRLDADSETFPQQVSKLIIEHHPTLMPLLFAGQNQAATHEHPSWEIDPQHVRTRPMLDQLGRYCAGTVSVLGRVRNSQLRMKSFSNLPGDSLQALHVQGIKLDSSFHAAKPPSITTRNNTEASTQHDGEIKSEDQISTPAPQDTLLHLTGGPKATTCEPGDEIWIILGGEMPFALRPRRDCYVIIGPVYVPGVMQGEFLLAQDHDISWREIKIV